MSSIIGLPLMGINVGAVRPLGKVADYDQQFEQLADQLAPARSDGLIDVVSTYNAAETKSMTIGAVKMGGYPLNPQFVLGVYRSVASNQTLLCSVLDPNAARALRDPANIDSLAISGVGDGAINNIPGLPSLDAENLVNDNVEAATQLARGRLATLIKCTGYCESKDIVPSYLSDGYSQTMETLLRNTSSLLDDVTDDPFWHRRNRVLDLSFKTLIDAQALDALSLSDILKLRTAEWGKFESLRDDLLRGAFEVATEAADEKDFQNFVHERLQQIRKTTAELETQRKSLGFRIKCDLGAGALSGGVALVTLQAPLNSIAAILAIGGVWALQQTKTYGDELMKIKQQEKEAEGGAGFAMNRLFAEIRRRA
ncbi:hypothetical protein [Roseiconus lacunae]|uniref:hypothetical protein n=1 Tax=Roseiconus lacunae TaxID=2605694 RepID=UPI001E36D595|nr:hypothetical protein [Roseiconus lacunae]MCD0459943.1 hypothetical protein [Roseiconus lacunae]